MEIIQGKKLFEISGEEFETLRSKYQEIWLDIGTGDGLFVYRTARDNPEILCVGMEPAWKNSSEASGKAARKDAKGGASNAIFVHAAIESPPLELRSCASRISINYPWGSLLRGLVEPVDEIISNIAKLGRGSFVLDIYLNYSVFEDDLQRVSLGLPVLSECHLDAILQPCYLQHGLAMRERSLIDGQPEIRTSWGSQLVLGSSRRSMYLAFESTGAG